MEKNEKIAKELNRIREEFTFLILAIDTPEFSRLRANILWDIFRVKGFFSKSLTLEDAEEMMMQLAHLFVNFLGNCVQKDSRELAIEDFLEQVRTALPQFDKIESEHIEDNHGQK